MFQVNSAIETAGNPGVGTVHAILAGEKVRESQKYGPLKVPGKRDRADDLCLSH